MYGLGGLQGEASKKKIALILAAIIVALVAAVAGFFVWQHFQDKPNARQTQSKETSTRILAKIGKIYDIPTNEQPTVAQVQDKAKLNGQVFFKKVQNGDFLVIYTEAKLALLYREQANKLINAGSINLNSDAADSANAPGTVKQ